MGILLAEEAEAAGGAMGMVSMVVLWAAMFAVLYFFILRPQNKEKKRVAAMLAELAAGDSVMTTSGFYGIVIGIEDDTVIVEFGNNKNCRIPMDKAAISKVEKPGE